MDDLAQRYKGLTVAVTGSNQLVAQADAIFHLAGNTSAYAADRDPDGRCADLRGSLPGRHARQDVVRSDLRRARDYALLFALNHSAEILAKERAFSAYGGKWITCVPHVQVLKDPLA